MKNIIAYSDVFDFMKTIPSGVVQLVISDPPYEFLSKNPTGGGFMHKENKQHLKKINETFGMSYEPRKYLNECKRVLGKFNGYFFTNKTLLKDYISFAEENGYKWDILIWSKPNPVPINNGHYLIDKEFVIFIKESGAVFNSKLGYQNYFTVRSFPIGGNEFGHPTQKPIEFIKQMIEVSSNKGDLIFDGYCGSGTSLVAAKQLERDYLGCDNDEKWAKFSEERLKITGNLLF